MTTRWIVGSVLLAASFVTSHAESAATPNLLKMSETERNSILATVVRSSGEKCVAVLRSIFEGGQQNTGDIWSVACKDGGSYRIQVKYDAGASTVYIYLRRIKRGAAGALPVDLICGSVATGAGCATVASRAHAAARIVSVPADTLIV
jgi:hypothetical protein